VRGRFKLPDVAHRVAWLAENSAEDDFLFASGRFRGYIDLGPGVGEEIEDASVEDALAWARERAPVVLIRLWDSDHYSAGERNPDRRSYQEWPADGIDVKPRRPRGLSARRGQAFVIMNDPPRVHGPEAGETGVWQTTLDCYEFLAEHVQPGARTLETGCGISTALFGVWGAEHTCVVNDQRQVDTLCSWAQQREIDLSRVTFEVGTSHKILPRLDPTPLDLVFVDGSHAFPAPIIDWFYSASRLREGGIFVMDNLELPSVQLGLVEFLSKDPRWELIANRRSWAEWAGFLRHSSGSLEEQHVDQRFLQDPT
jgi:uncharacterized protein YciI